MSAQRLAGQSIPHRLSSEYWETAAFCTVETRASQIGNCMAWKKAGKETSTQPASDRLPTAKVREQSRACTATRVILRNVGPAISRVY